MSDMTGNRSRTAAIATVCGAQVVVVLDVSVVASALPSIGVELDAGAGALAWVASGYTLVFGGLLVLGGRLADVIGHRLTFLSGLLVFTLASGACAGAWSIESLVAARVVQGAGAALLAPAALAGLMHLTPDGSARRRAVGWWTAVASGGGATGWVIGALVTEKVGWRWVFGVNLPVGLVLLGAALALLPGGRSSDRRSLDAPGALLATGTLAALVLALTEAGERGWGRPLVAVSLVAAVALGLLLMVRELRASDPALPGGLMRSRPVLAAALVGLALTAASSPAMFLAVLWAEDIVGAGATTVASLFPTLNVAVVVASLVGPRVLRRLGARPTMLLGLVAVALGASALLTVGPTEVPVGRLLPAFVLIGAGLGVASVAATDLGTTAAPTEHRGVAAGVLTAAAQVGTAIGVALLVPLAERGDGVMTGFRLGWTGAAVIALLGCIAAVAAGTTATAARRGRRRPQRRPASPAAGPGR